MRHTLTLLAATAALTASVAATAADAIAATPEAGWNAIVACADRADERQRHACIDDVLRGAGVLTDAQQQRDRRQRFGGVVADPEAAAAEPDTIDVEVASVSESRDGRFTFTTRDGATWRQIESRIFALTPAAGQTLTIQKAALGSFLCTLNGRSPFRCSRTR